MTAADTRNRRRQRDRQRPPAARPQGERQRAPDRQRRSRNGEPSAAAYLEAAEIRAQLREFLKSTEQILRAHSLTPERYELLLAIKTAPDGGERATVGWLAQLLGVAQSSVTQLVRRAENARLLRRQVSSKDARVRYLSLTRTGERRLAAALAALAPERTRLAALCAGQPSALP